MALWLLARLHADVAAAAGGLPQGLAEPLVLIVALFASHIAEELWSRMGHATSLAYEPFPQFDEPLAAEPVVTLPVQIDGKTRFRVEVPADAGEEQIAEAMASHPEYARHTGGATVSRVVIVPGRIVNIVTPAVGLLRKQCPRRCGDFRYDGSHGP